MPSWRMSLSTSLVLTMMPCSISRAARMRSTRRWRGCECAASVQVGDRVAEQRVTDLAVAGLAELDVVVGAERQPRHPTSGPFGVAQVTQPSNNPELPFGSAGSPSSNRALAALTSLSSASRSLIFRRAWMSGSTSKLLGPRSRPASTSA
jgi:hypothetical protein